MALAVPKKSGNPSPKSGNPSPKSGGGPARFNPNRIYDEIRHLGSGAFGAAFLVRRKRDGRRFVAKKCCIEGMPEKQRAMCLEEIRLLRQAKHDCIAQYVDFVWSSRDKMNYWLVLKYYPGGDVGDQIKGCVDDGTELPPGKICNWLTQLCMALQFVHKLNIIHRDVKPTNLFMTGTENIVLGDFGVSKQLSENTQRAGTAVGSPTYMAPEWWDGRGGTQASDMWSVGIVAYELTALVRPFDAGNVLSLVHKITNEEPPDLPDDCDSDFQSFVKRLLSKRPAERPTATEALASSCLKRCTDILKIYRKGLEKRADKSLMKAAREEDRAAGILLSPAKSTSQESDSESETASESCSSPAGVTNLIALARSLSPPTLEDAADDEEEEDEGDEEDEDGDEEAEEGSTCGQDEQEDEEEEEEDASEREEELDSAGELSDSWQDLSPVAMEEGAITFAPEQIEALANKAGIAGSGRAARATKPNESRHEQSAMEMSASAGSPCAANCSTSQSDLLANSSATVQEVTRACDMREVLAAHIEDENGKPSTPTDERHHDDVEHTAFVEITRASDMRAVLEAELMEADKNLRDEVERTVFVDPVSTDTGQQHVEVERTVFVDPVNVASSTSAEQLSCQTNTERTIFIEPVCGNASAIEHVAQDCQTERTLFVDPGSLPPSADERLSHETEVERTLLVEPVAVESSLQGDSESSLQGGECTLCPSNESCSAQAEQTLAPAAPAPIVKMPLAYRPPRPEGHRAASKEQPASTINPLHAPPALQQTAEASKASEARQAELTLMSKSDVSLAFTLSAEGPFRATDVRSGQDISRDAALTADSLNTSTSFTLSSDNPLPATDVLRNLAHTEQRRRKEATFRADSTNDSLVSFSLTGTDPLHGTDIRALTGQGRRKEVTLASAAENEATVSFTLTSNRALNATDVDVDSMEATAVSFNITPNATLTANNPGTPTWGERRTMGREHDGHSGNETTISFELTRDQALEASRAVDSKSETAISFDVTGADCLEGGQSQALQSSRHQTGVAETLRLTQAPRGEVFSNSLEATAVRSILAAEVASTMKPDECDELAASAAHGTSHGNAGCNSLGASALRSILTAEVASTMNPLQATTGAETEYEATVLVDIAAEQTLATDASNATAEQVELNHDDAPAIFVHDIDMPGNTRELNPQLQEVQAHTLKSPAASSAGSDSWGGAERLATQDIGESTSRGTCVAKSQGLELDVLRSVLGGPAPAPGSEVTVTQALDSLTMDASKSKSTLAIVQPVEDEVDESFADSDESGDESGEEEAAEDEEEEYLEEPEEEEGMEGDEPEEEEPEEEAADEEAEEEEQEEEDEVEEEVDIDVGNPVSARTGTMPLAQTSRHTAGGVEEPSTACEKTQMPAEHHTVAIESETVKAEVQEEDEIEDEEEEDEDDEDESSPEAKSPARGGIWRFSPIVRLNSSGTAQFGQSSVSELAQVSSFSVPPRHVPPERRSPETSGRRPETGLLPRM